ncbi:hypothetical protein [Arenimonas sp. MALMAid1274]|uniref:hypothetical protein n=1 Tax=Arenimonas sp. MALMAid1274 TaxID=3411630 RepID=UPI003BA218A2
MSREDYVAIGVRLFAVFVGIKTLLAIPASVQVLVQGDSMDWAWAHASVLSLTVALCAFLWFFPLTIARKLLPVMKEPRSEATIDASVGMSLGLTLLGVWFLAQGLMDLLYWLTLLVRTNYVVRAQQYDHVWQPDQIASMAATAFELVIGAVLILGSSGIRRGIYRFRYGNI